MPDLCVVPGCRSRGRFGFTRDPELRQKWLAAIRKESVGVNGRICESHFKPGEITQGLMAQYSAYQVRKTSEHNQCIIHGITNNAIETGYKVAILAVGFIFKRAKDGAND